MIQQNYKNSVQETSEGVTTTGFSIEVNESMFEMLTAKVYNDPLLAVVREWSTNACDACIAAELPIRYDVHLPTAEETYFSVRDYGTGLAPEDIVGLFSNLGASTKRNSNAFNGTLGIGRMAGLAASDSFSVDSYYNGTQYSYLVSVQKGVPVTMHLGENPTNEPNGLCLSVDVEPDNINRYKEKAEALYPYFDHKPNLNIEAKTDLVIEEQLSDNWFFKSRDMSRFSQHNYVVMSQVVYEIPQNSAINHYGFANLVIKVPPGSVTFNPGRESLSLDKSTIEFLNRQFREIKEEYASSALIALSETENDVELIKKYQYLKERTPSELIKQIDYLPFASDTLKAMHSATTASYYSVRPIYATSAFLEKTGHLLALTYKSRHLVTAKKVNNENKINVDTFLSANHVVVDVKTRFKSTLTQHYSGQDLITWQREGTADLNESVKTAKETLEDMGVPYKLASDILKEYEGVADETGEKKKRVEALYTSHVTSNNAIGKSSLHPADLVETQDYLCLRLSNTTPVLANTEVDFEEYMAVYRHLAVIEDMPKVMGVPKKYQNYVNDLDNWYDFETYIKERIQQYSFRRPADYHVPTTVSRIINEDNYDKFPEVIQLFYKELKGYREYMSGQYYVDSPYTANAFKRLGAEFVPYEPQYDVDMEVLDTYYANTQKIITTYLTSDVALAINVAKLERFHELHSTKQ